MFFRKSCKLDPRFRGDDRRSKGRARKGGGLTAAILFLFFLFALPAQASPAKQIIIRDAEIEQTLKDWSGPVIRAAGLDANAVKIILVQSPDLNAFVAGGQNIFIYTGLLEKTESPAEVIGVIAHEAGHIAGGHLVRGKAQLERASYETMLGTILGVGVAAATGSGQAGMAVVGGAQTLAQRNFLAFSRTQESSADQAALRFLRRAGISPQGLTTFLEKLEDQELLPAAQQNEYARTHPISRDRIETLSAATREGPTAPAFTAPQTEAHARMKAKLQGFITPQQIGWIYPQADRSVAADYARAIADYRQNRVEAALSQIEALIAREPKNPYFYELKGQMLYEFGRAREAIPAYARATELAPKQPLIRLAYAQALVENPRAEKGTLECGAQMLEQVRDIEPRNARVYRLLGSVYGRLKREGEAQAMLAEEAFLQARYDESRRLAQGALAQIPKGARARRWVEDLLAQLDQKEKKKARGE